MQKTIKGNLISDGWKGVSEMESLHRATCPRVSLNEVKAVNLAEPTWIRWGLLQKQASLIAAERWTVNRCGAQHTYRVNYFRGEDGNSFFTKVVPLEAGGVVDFVRVAAHKQWQRLIGKG